MPRDQATGTRHMATRNERVRVIELHAEGKSYRQIANETGISKDAAREIIKYWTTTGELNPPSRPGKPPVLSERDIRHLVRLSDSHPRATLAELAQEASLGYQTSNRWKIFAPSKSFRLPCPPQAMARTRVSEAKKEVV